MKSVPNPRSRIQRNPEIVSSSIDGEVVMMSMDRGEYFGLNATGSQIWNLLEEPRSMDDLCSALRDRFEVPEAQCREEVALFLDAVAASGLVTLCD